MDNNTSPVNQSFRDGELPTFRPRLSFFHANARGTGCSVQLEVRPAHGITDGSILMTLANQLTVGDRRGPNPVYPTFDRENRIIVKLGFLDVAKMLQVFRGECETIDDGMGLIHRSAQFNTKIALRHLVEPVSGYMLDVYRSANGREDQHAGFLFSPAEAMGLTKAIEDSLGVLCFGIPMVTEYERQQDLALRQAQAQSREVRDARVA